MRTFSLTFIAAATLISGAAPTLAGPGDGRAFERYYFLIADDRARLTDGRNDQAMEEARASVEAFKRLRDAGQRARRPR